MFVDMKRTLIVIALTVMALSSCFSEHEWLYGGWSEVYNDLDATVTLVTTYPPFTGSETPPVTSIIKPSDYIKLDIGAYIYGRSIDECLTATIILSDGTEILCSKGTDNTWSKRFFENYKQRKKVEWVGLDRHDMVVRTYHIDQKLINLWKSGQGSN